MAINLRTVPKKELILTKLKMNHAVSPLDNPHQISANKKTIARLETELRKREIENNK